MSSMVSVSLMPYLPMIYSGVHVLQDIPCVSVSRSIPLGDMTALGQKENIAERIL